MQWSSPRSIRSTKQPRASSLRVASIALLCSFPLLSLANGQAGPQDASALPQDSESSSVADDGTEASKDQTDSAPKPYRNELVRGRVVWLADALKKQHGISSVPEVAEHVLALVSEEGEIIPLVENERGRAFRKDERLRKMEVEILLRRYTKQPLAQVLRLYEVDGDKKFEVDYWCDVCAIPMYETGPCSCCQDHNRLRKRPVEGPIDTGIR